jgi:hypothetical protein
MSAEKSYLMTIDGRDLFDLIRGTIKSAIEDFGTDDKSTACWIWQEATERTVSAMNMWNNWNKDIARGSDCVREPVRIYDEHGRSIELMLSPQVARQIKALRDERDYLMLCLRRARSA